LTLSNFVAVNGVFFTADIIANGMTGNVASNGPGIQVPEPKTWLMFFAGLVGLTFLQRRRRKLARAT
jgi:hypothetical protein